MSAHITQIASIGLVFKENNPAARQVGESMRAWLEEQGVTVWLAPRTELAAREELLDCTDLLLALGGDGTIVSIARQLLGRSLPLAGVNFGRVGFLAELTPENWQESLTRVLRQGIRVRARMSLRYTLTRAGGLVGKGEVINDVVVTRGKLARLVHLELGVDDERFMVLRSDGIILSTPTGSSGYSCSAGGPLLQPTTNSYVVAAICPFLSGFPPMVMGAETPFTVTVGEAGTDLYLTLDGQETRSLEKGDCLRVYGEPGRFLVADMGLAGYFERLRLAGFVQESRDPAG